ncbi:T9SS type A sorting domain-containing protein [Candidatus Venteria ishoeyi]|uniref:Secretion system C-terminal sorting domain-containing protein n=1 Tax=Candidatus Venteria ishoeyi TaxID=1899563 RepID=A0A1H6F8T5_9GAMM|nr:PCMD domain-containing protein [Candidatus Venteria ishoeyi]SEH06510.1 Uncharacterised protein [Candidatus Venteria ishoeyi]
MKKLIKVISFSILLSFFPNANIQGQTSQIPNGGFEDWDASLGYDNPTYWDSPNATISSLFSNSFVVFEDNDSVYAGTSSVFLESKDVTIFTTTISVLGMITLGDLAVNLSTQEVNISGGTPYSGNPNKLTGYYNYSPVNADQCYFEVVLLNYDIPSSTTLDTIGAGTFIGTSATTGWELFEVPITYYDTTTPNYLNITILSSNPNNVQAGSIMYVDELSMEGDTIDYQNLNLPQGWSFFSTYIIPFEENLDSLCAPFVSEVIIAKDGDGLTYWPQWGLNNIGEILLGDGYQIKMATTQTMLVAGLAVVPENTLVTIDQGWSFLGYLRQSPAPVDVILSLITSEVNIVKNGDGLTYWPQYGVNAIGNMIPGQGYQLKMNSQQTIVYPANSVLFTKQGTQNLKPTHYKLKKNTGSNMSLGIFTSDFEVGTEIGAFSDIGELVGSAIVTGDLTAITLWGDDETTPEIDGLIEGEEFTIKSWNGEESIIEVESWLEGSGSFETNKIAIAESFSESQFPSFKLYQNTPNPFTHETEFRFYLPENSKGEFTILNMLGEKIETLISNEMESGNQSLRYQTKELSAGNYYYRLKTSENSITKKMVIIK